MQANQDFYIGLKTIDCFIQKRFAILHKCEIEYKDGKTGASFNTTILTNITKISLRGMFFSMNKGKYNNLVDLRDIDACKAISDTSMGAMSRIVKAFKQILLEKGDLPKCPMLKNTRLLFNMVRMDYSSFPYLPEMDFKVVIIMSLNNVPSSYHINVTGAIVNRKKGLF